MKKTYPILTDRYKPEQALQVVCPSCGATAKGDPGENSDGMYECPQKCGGLTTWMYVEADRCGGCGKLGHYEKVLDYCCSRVCQLQKGYARELEARRA